jgi:hypothetical protein
VQPALAAGLEFEMLDGVGDEDAPAVDAGLGDGAVQYPPRRPYKRLARQILAVARLLADQHQQGSDRAFARHYLGRGRVKRAAPAFGLGGASSASEPIVARTGQVTVVPIQAGSALAPSAPSVTHAAPE